MITRLNSPITKDNKKDEDGFQKVLPKNFARESNNIFEEKSQKFLPINLPLFELEIHTTSVTKFVIPVTISIKSHKDYPYGLKMSRLLVAMLKAIQMAYQDSYIGPISPD
jgi:hypothetical protein